jgi:XTP/dITP diphosphohydrolase
MTQLLIATHNPGKLAEFRTIMDGLGLQLRRLDDLGITQDVEETGTSFVENAVLKAQVYAQLSGLPTLADDSGLEVAALNGEPGVYSARYAGPNKTDAERNAFLLEKLKGLPFHARMARFVCAIALALPDGSLETVEGYLPGVIEEVPRGTGGFGYDPLFYLLDAGVTLAELPPERKNQLSHRARAAEQARAILARWIAEGKLGQAFTPYLRGGRADASA